MVIQEKYSGLKIVWHPKKLKSFLKNEIIPPLYVRIKPTNKCNHRCFYCSYDPQLGHILSENFNRNDEIPKEKMMEILNDFKEMGVKAVTFSGGGEPLIYPYIEEAMQKCLDYGIDLSIITNGQQLKGRKAEILSKSKWVRISLDACKADTFEKNRRVPKQFFDDLIENIRNFAKIKNKKCELGINFVIHHLNWQEVYDAVKFFKELKVNHIKFTPRWIENSEKWLEYHAPFKEKVIEQIKKAKKDFGDKNLDIFDTYENDFLYTGNPERKYLRCYIMQTIPVIGADSVVYFCHDKTYTTNGSLGSIKDKSFKDLWFSKEAEEKFKNFNPKNSCKHHCTYDTRNIFINDAISCFGNHINFP